MGVLLVTGILKEITCLQAVADDEACKYGYESWIAYCYKTNIFTRFITICSCCKKSFTNDNSAVGEHVLAEYGRLDTEGRLIYTKCITPICKKCNDRFKNNQAWKVFKVRGYHLCRVPNKPPKR